MASTTVAAASRQRRIRDMLAGDIGMLRVMFHEAGQKSMCPPIPAIAHDIADRYGIRDPADMSALLDLLATAQPAGTHQVADFNILSRTLRKHRHSQMQDAHQELLSKQRKQTAAREASASPRRKTTARVPGHGGAAASASASAPAAHPAAADTGLRTGSPEEWVTYLRKSLGNPTARSMSWPHFAAAVQAASFTSGIGKIDMWQARQHFLGCCSGSVPSVHGASAPIARLAYVTQTTDTPNRRTMSGTSSGAKMSLSWVAAAPSPQGGGLSAAGEHIPGPPELRAGPVSEPRQCDPLRPGTATARLDSRRSSTRADRLRATAISSMRKNEILHEESIQRGLPIPLLRAKIPLPPPIPKDPKDWKAPTGRPRVRPASAR